MLGLGLGLKAKIFGLKAKIFGLSLGLEAQVFGLGLDLAPCGFVNINIVVYIYSQSHYIYENE